MFFTWEWVAFFFFSSQQNREWVAFDRPEVALCRPLSSSFLFTWLFPLVILFLKWIFMDWRIFPSWFLLHFMTFASTACQTFELLLSHSFFYIIFTFIFRKKITAHLLPSERVFNNHHIIMLRKIVTMFTLKRGQLSPIYFFVRDFWNNCDWVLAFSMKVWYWIIDHLDWTIVFESALLDQRIWGNVWYLQQK